MARPRPFLRPMGPHADAELEREAAALTGKLDTLLDRLEGAIDELEQECEERERHERTDGCPPPRT